MRRLATALVLTTLVGTNAAHAQPPSWVALDGQPAGTPASVVLNTDASSPIQSVFDVTIHGFWSTPKSGPGGAVFQSIEVPGLPNMAQNGAPNLPVCRFQLGITNGAASADLQPALVFSSVGLPGYNVWPEPIEAMLHDGDPEVFQQDPTIYSTPGPWPVGDGPPSTPVGTLLGFLPSASTETYPIHWDPISGLLTVATSARYRFAHSGPSLALPLTTPSQRNVLSHLVDNWQTVGPNVIADPMSYSGYYLIITPQLYQTNLQPLVDQKKAHGLKVTELFMENIGGVCQNVRNAIGTWYNSTPKGAEHYCLLVGDVSEVPICNGPATVSDPFGPPSDDPYGTPFTLNNDRQIMVGRISPQAPSDLDFTIQGIINYEDHPVMDNHYENVLLIAHGGVIGTSDPIWPYQEKVRTAPYLNPPSFYTYYGNVIGNTNAGLSAAIQNSPYWGIVDYFGHGALQGWSGWDLTNESYTNSNVGFLSLAPRNPIVWSTACQTGGIQFEDCFGEAWTHRYGLGAVAFYGSTVNAYAYPAIELHQDLFYAVYSQDIKKQGFTYFDAEYRMENLKKKGDSWKFLLLGDPEMQIRTSQPNSPWVITAPWIEHVACGANCPQIRMYVSMASTGGPASGVMVSAYQPGGPVNPGVQENRYTDASGLAAIPVAGLGDGFVCLTTMDTQGHGSPDTIWVQGGNVTTGVGGSPAARGGLSLRALPNVVHAGTLFSLGRPAGTGARVEVYDAIGRRVRTLPIASGALNVRWDGGDVSGHHARSGVYLARYHDAEGEANARLVLLQ